MISWIFPRVSFFCPPFDPHLLLVLTDQLATLVEAGRMTMEQVSYSLRQTVFGILKTLVVHASQNQLELTYDIDPDIPDQLIGDSLRLRQVITNLVGNAIKFTPSKEDKKGHVALTCRLVQFDERGVTIEFCVLDTGIGIAKDKLSMIFDTFCQADGSTTRVRPFSLPFHDVLTPINRNLYRSMVELVSDYPSRNVSSTLCMVRCGSSPSSRLVPSFSSPLHRNAA